MIEAHIRALEQSTMIELTLFASQSKQIIIKILDLKDIVVSTVALKWSFSVRSLTLHCPNIL